MSNTTYNGNTLLKEQSGGRVILLLLLFVLAVYQFCTSGIGAMAAVCLLPAIAIIFYLIIKYDMFVVYMLLLANYFLFFASRHGFLPAGVPMSLYNEGLEILLIMTALAKGKDISFKYMANPMGLGLVIWSTFCILELLNDSCGLGINFMIWFTGARLMAFQLVYALVIAALYINNPERIMKFLYMWGALCLFASFWTWKQQHWGFTQAEQQWLDTGGAKTHIIYGGALIRYFSTFSDAANHGCHMAGAAVTFIIIAITNKIWKTRIFFFICGLAAMWSMFQSGTRTAMFCMIGGFLVFLFLSKSIKIIIPFSIIFAFFFFILAFTNIGQGNQSIRRMRSAFNKNDASMGVREYNQMTMKKYMKDIPWGLGIGMESQDVPRHHKLKVLSQLAPDSEYVYIWVRTGKVGISVFVFTVLLMSLGACCYVFFKIKDPQVRGIGAGLTCAFFCIQVGGYANQVLMQFPNCFIFYCGLAIVFILPYIEDGFKAQNEKALEKQNKWKQKRLEKKRAKRV